MKINKRVKRRISFGIFLYFFLSFTATSSLPHVENCIIAIGIPPYWDHERMIQYKWNNILVQTGKPPRNWHE
jgi:hypothetical protein